MMVKTRKKRMGRIVQLKRIGSRVVEVVVIVCLAGVRIARATYSANLLVRMSLQLQETIVIVGIRRT